MPADKKYKVVKEGAKLELAFAGMGGAWYRYNYILKRDDIVTYLGRDINGYSDTFEDKFRVRLSKNLISCPEEVVNNPKRWVGPATGSCPIISLPMDCSITGVIYNAFDYLKEV